MQPIFQPAVDVVGAAVLVAVPALLANGLFAHVESFFTEPAGYYPMVELFLLVEFMILARIKSVEQLRYQPCGEWGRILGLDRIPEVRTLRRKLALLAQPHAVRGWAEAMGRFWMEQDPQLAGLLYIDGHVRAYHGEQTDLPKRFSSRERLTVRSLMDYWVNDREGRPFFVVTAIGTEGLLHHLREQIVPRLLQEVPGQPTQEQLEADTRLHRFVMVFDREGWSPEWFAELWTVHRIAIITYRKGHFQDWAPADFTEQVVDLPHGNQTPMLLADKSYDHLEQNVPAREIRRLSEDRAHQTSIITTLRVYSGREIAGHMFSRWTQENFFQYAARELAIDRLAGYQLSTVTDDSTVINPPWRELNSQLRRLAAERAKVSAERGQVSLEEPEGRPVVAYAIESVRLDEHLKQLDRQIRQHKVALKQLPKRVPLADLPENQRPKLVAPYRHQLLNTCKILAYRAETALVMLLRTVLARTDDARNLIKDLLRHPADLVPDVANATLLVRIHHFTNPQSSTAIHHLLQLLNETGTLFPGSKLRLQFELVSKVVSPQLPPNQEV